MSKGIQENQYYFGKPNKNGKVIDENNSLPLLRHKYGVGATYHSVR